MSLHGGWCAPAYAQLSRADVLVGQAIVEFDDRQYARARETLRHALALEPDNLEALYYAGLVELAANQPADAATHLERAHGLFPDSAEVSMQLGFAYFTLGASDPEAYRRARPLLEQAYRRDPTIDTVGYAVGFMRYRTGDYRGALDAFRSGRSGNAEIRQLTQFYSGLALGNLGLLDQAANELQRAIEIVPGSAVSNAARDLRTSVAAAARPERAWSVEAQIGVFYDDNFAVVPDRATGNLLVGDLRRQRHESTGQRVSLRGEYRLLRTEDWESSVGGSVLYNRNDERSDFDVADFLVEGRLIRRMAIGRLPAQVGAEYAFDDLLLDGDEFLRRHTVTLLAAVMEDSRNSTQAFLRYQSKDFRDRPVIHDESRDADYWSAGLLHVVSFARHRHFVKAGYQLDYDETEGRNYEYVGHRLVLGGQLGLPWRRSRLRYDLDVHFRNYVHRHSFLPAPDTRRRRDTEIVNAVRFDVPLWANLTVGVEYQSTLNESNLAVFDYTRNVYGLTLSWSY